VATRLLNETIKKKKPTYYDEGEKERTETLEKEVRPSTLTAYRRAGPSTCHGPREYRSWKRGKGSAEHARRIAPSAIRKEPES